MLSSSLSVNARRGLGLMVLSVCAFVPHSDVFAASEGYAEVVVEAKGKESKTGDDEVEDRDYWGGERAGRKGSGTGGPSTTTTTGGSEPSAKDLDREEIAKDPYVVYYQAREAFIATECSELIAEVNKLNSQLAPLLRQMTAVKNSLQIFKESTPVSKDSEDNIRRQKTIDTLGDNYKYLKNLAGAIEQQRDDVKGALDACTLEASGRFPTYEEYQAEAASGSEESATEVKKR